ncbi:TPR-like protein [Sistotremastrum niveocremeum HHB9708]|uniref:TPR-like protein n=1 Tax=Sistotremastrum niveocremeum HHB9708 TaxID=1314777 RepID=A0A164VQJ7_9AGAM|nr:TPR-like protein [Sistotremastrum niveocremeum HHB9708]
MALARTLATSSRLLARQIQLASGRTTVSKCYSLPARVCLTTRRLASSTTPYSTSHDIGELQAQACLEQGTQKLETGDLQGAKGSYQASVDIRRNASSLFNLGVAHYHLKEFDQAIDAWRESIQLQPSSPDAHTNLASAYIVSPNPRPDLALQHLHTAASLAPEDPEIAFNLGAVLEACGRLEEALQQYKRSEEGGVQKATAHISNLSAKLLVQKFTPQKDDPSKN